MVWGKPKEPVWRCGKNDATIFFITEKTMRDHEWKEIHQKQLFVRKIRLTEKELVKKNWLYTYETIP